MKKIFVFVAFLFLSVAVLMPTNAMAWSLKNSVSSLVKSNPAYMTAKGAKVVGKVAWGATKITAKVAWGAAKLGAKAAGAAIKGGSNAIQGFYEMGRANVDQYSCAKNQISVKEAQEYAELLWTMANGTADEKAKAGRIINKGGNFNGSEIKGTDYYATKAKKSGADACKQALKSIQKAVAMKCKSACKQSADAACEKCNSTAEFVQNQIEGDLKEIKKYDNDRCNQTRTIIQTAKGMISGATSGWNIGKYGMYIGSIGVVALSTAYGALSGAIKGWLDASVITVPYSAVQTLFMLIDEGCWFCPVFHVVYSIANGLATEIYDFLRDVFLAFLALFGFGWILFHVARMLTTLHGPSIGEFFTQMFKTLGTLMISCAFLAPSISFLTGYFVDVPTIFAIKLSETILQEGGMGGDNIAYSAFTENPECTERDEKPYLEETKVAVCEKSDPADYKDKAMSAEVHDSLSCLLKRVSIRLIKGIALGVTLICVSFFSGFGGILPSFSMMLVGLLVTIGYASLFIQVPIMMLNLILRFCLFMILFPIFVVCYPFQSLRGYTKKGWDMLMSVLLNIICLCIFIAIAMALLDSVFQL